jgi:hypothetical protein
LSATTAGDAQRELDAALPALDAAVASLNNLSKSDIVEVKALQNPPEGVRIVMKAACIMFGEKPKMKDDPDNMGELLQAVRWQGVPYALGQRPARHVCSSLMPAGSGHLNLPVK